ncbi:AMP-binding protein [Nonomuraea jabiensis]|uniref:AMP-binding protein n=1 Tax=Nonomuraea jabiensis TaxID=882448 RepID=UPI0034369701
MKTPHDSVIYSELLVEALTRYREREAFVAGDRRMSYADAANLVGRLHSALRERGVGPDAGVVMLSPNAPEAWLVQAATYLLGARFSGIHLLSSRDDGVWLCDDVEPSVLVVHPTLIERGAAIHAGAASVQHLLTLGPAETGEDLLKLAAQVPAGQLLPGPADPDTVAWVQYTGGTTGKPKGVVMTHRSMAQQAMSWLSSYSVPERPRYLAASPITHAGVLPVLPTLLHGGTVVLHSSFNPLAWLETVEHERINFAFAVPTMLYALCDAADGSHDLSSLETVVYGASPMNPSRIDDVRAILGDVLVQAYASTETCGITMFLRKDEHIPELYTSCGRPAVGITAELLDTKGMPVPEGEIGEICVRSPAVMQGYWKRPELTAQALADGWLHTGDLARRDERGFFHIVDRINDMIISGGYNIYPKEVEDAISSHPAVASVAVIGVPDEKWGEAVKACVVLRQGFSATAEEIIEVARQMKGKHYAPKSVDFIDEIPVTAVGKFDKKSLRQRYWSGQTRQVH